MRTTLTVVLLAVVLGPARPPALSAQQQQPTQPQIDAMLARMRPGPEHKDLHALVGRWNQEITYDMGGKTLAVKGTATNRLILGGRFLTSERTADNPAGAAFGEPTTDALTIYGFDRRTGEFTILELDTMGTYSVSAAGAMGPDRTILMSGETQDDHSGRAETRKFDMVLKIIDPDTYETRIVFKFTGKPDLTLVRTTARRIK